MKLERQLRNAQTAGNDVCCKLHLNFGRLTTDGSLYVQKSFFLGCILEPFPKLSRTAVRLPYRVYRKSTLRSKDDFRELQAIMSNRRPQNPKPCDRER